MTQVNRILPEEEVKTNVYSYPIFLAHRHTRTHKYKHTHTHTYITYIPNKEM